MVVVVTVMVVEIMFCSLTWWIERGESTCEVYYAWVLWIGTRLSSWVDKSSTVPQCSMSIRLYVQSVCTVCMNICLSVLIFG